MRTAIAVLVLFTSALLFAQQAPPDQSTYPAETHKMNRAEKKSTAETHGQAVDLNSATKKELAALPGVGPDYAQTIIDARPFRSKEDLIRKKVIPQSVYDQIQDRIDVGTPKPATESPK